MVEGFSINFSPPSITSNLKKFSPPSRASSYQLTTFSSSLSTATSLKKLSKSTFFVESTTPSPSETIFSIPSIDGVIRYNLYSNRSKGSMGKLILSNNRLKFVNYNESDSITYYSSNRVPPFTVHSPQEESAELPNEDLDLMNVYDLKLVPIAGSTGNSHVLLEIYCNDFRFIEYQLRNTELVKNFLETLERANNEDSVHLPKVWELIQWKHPFSRPEDWYREEGYWLKKGSEFRVTQSNEAFQLCPSLPPSFPSLKFYLTDVNLTQMISAQLKHHRVPLISFAFSSSNGKKRILMRSPNLTPDVDNLLYTAVAPLRMINLNSLLPDIGLVITAHRKLRMASYLHNSEEHFFFRVGKWLKLVTKILAVLHDLVSILKEEASLLLMEEFDDSWNPFMSSLIQIAIDPYRRTINGFEALLSKEWIYYSGLPFLSSASCPNDLLFILFLDCVWQLHRQNKESFQFSSLYLIHLFDLLWLPSFSKKDNFRAKNLFDEILPKTLEGFCLDQLMFFHNPWYNKFDWKDIRILSDVFSVKLWTQLYLRWHQDNLEKYFFQFPPQEYIYFYDLLKSFPKTVPSNNFYTKDQDEGSSYRKVLI